MSVFIILLLIKKIKIKIANKITKLLIKHNINKNGCFFFVATKKIKKKFKNIKIQIKIITDTQRDDVTVL
jgi:hypothetical protein